MATITAPLLFAKQATDLGTFYVSTCSKGALKHYLRGCATTQFKTAAWRKEWWENDAELRRHLHNHDPRSFQKSAAIGGEQEGQFEQAFSSLAYAYLKDKSPRLLDFIVGFQLVDRNEDNTKAIGIFGFKIGEQWLYAPVFFLNGDMKGHELLYIKNQDLFVPLKENWVNYLISRKPHVLGESSPQRTHELGGLMPNLSKLSRPPMGSKSASARDMPLIDSWALPMLPVMAAFQTKQAFDTAHEALKTQLDLGRFLRLSPALAKMAYERAYLRYPAIKVGFDKFYGPDFFKTVIADAEKSAEVRSTDLVGRVKKAGTNYVLPPKKPKPSPFLIPPKEEEKVEHPIKSGALRVIHLRDHLKVAETMAVDEEAPSGFKRNKPQLTEAEREKLLNDTVLIKDERDPSSVSIAYNTQVKMDITNPSETGLYEVLEKPGAFNEMLVIHNPQDGQGRRSFAVVLRKSSPRNWANIHPTNLWVKQCDCPVKADFVKYVDGLDGVKSMEKGGTYVAIAANGAGTCPFTITETYDGGVYKVDWKNYARYDQERPNGLPALERSTDPYYSPYDQIIRINEREGCSLRSNNGQLSIPAAYKIIKVADPPKPKKNDDLVAMCHPSSCTPSSGSADEPIQPGSIGDIQALLHEKTAQLKIHDLGAGEVFLTSPRGTQQLDKQAALISLVTEHGFDEATSRQLLKEANELLYCNRAATFRVKYASPFLQPGPGAPAFPEPWMGVEQNGNNSVNAIYPQEEFLPVPELDSHLTDPSTYDPFFEPDHGAMQVAQQASNAGQKEVFDASMISGMLKAVRQDSLVDRYLGDLMKALDKIARILFMFYWHQEEFEDRYGKQDLPELEDSLRNAFEMLGDVVLFLKEKSVGGGAGLEMSGVGGKSSPSEPSLEETARN